MAIPAKSEWLAEHARISFFVDPSASAIEQPNLWKSLVGKEPESRQTRPAEGTRVDEGPFGDHKLVVSTAIGRVDIILAPVVLPGWPTVGKPEDALNQLRALIEPILGSIGPVHRIALGGASFVKSASKIDGYSKLASLIPDVNFRPEMSDFYFQINYQREMKSSSGLIVNRIGKWFAGTVNFAQIPNTAVPIHAEMGHMVRCESDINTDAAVKLNLSLDEIKSVLNEMIGLSFELTYEGSKL